MASKVQHVTQEIKIFVFVHSRAKKKKIVKEIRTIYTEKKYYYWLWLVDWF